MENKKIKVIDLLNMLANKDEKLPKKLEFPCGDIATLKSNSDNVYWYSTEEDEYYVLASDVTLTDELGIIEESILNEKERDYLGKVIEPFRARDVLIVKSVYGNLKTNLERITISYTTLLGTRKKIKLYEFEKNSQFSNMELNKTYELNDLGL